MNYLAHALRFLDRPYYVAGVCLPDLLSVADRGVRLRARRVTPFLDAALPDEAELYRGILQHLATTGSTPLGASRKSPGRSRSCSDSRSERTIRLPAVFSVTS
jgi:hypothetical protein